MKTRISKTLDAAAGVAAIVASLPLAINAYADPPPTTPEAPIPDPQGPGCDAFKTALPNWKVRVLETGMLDRSGFGIITAGTWLTSG